MTSINVDDRPSMKKVAKNDYTSTQFSIHKYLNDRFLYCSINTHQKEDCVLIKNKPITYTHPLGTVTD